MLLSHCDEIAVTTPYKHTKSQNILSLFVAPPFLTFFALCATVCFQLLFSPSSSLCVLGPVMSWFGFLGLPEAHFSSHLHLHHPPIPLPNEGGGGSYASLFSSLNASSPPRTFQVFRLLSSAFIFFLYSHGTGESNTLHCHGLPTEVPHVWPMWSCLKGVKNVWTLVLLPEARHRQHYPRLCGRMFKWGTPSHLVYNEWAYVSVQRYIKQFFKE